MVFYGRWYQKYEVLGLKGVRIDLVFMEK